MFDHCVRLLTRQTTSNLDDTDNYKKRKSQILKSECSWSDSSIIVVRIPERYPTQLLFTDSCFEQRVTDAKVWLGGVTFRDLRNLTHTGRVGDKTGQVLETEGVWDGRHGFWVKRKYWRKPKNVNVERDFQKFFRFMSAHVRGVFLPCWNFMFFSSTISTQNIIEQWAPFGHLASIFTVLWHS